MKTYFLILLTFMIHACCPGVQAQTTPNTQTIFDGIDAKTNFVQNPYARLNTLNTTVGGSATNDRSTSSTNINGLAAHTCTTTATNSYCQLAVNNPTAPYNNPNQMCEARIFFKGSGANLMGLVVDSQQLALYSTTDFAQAYITVPCSASAPVLKLQQLVAGTPGAVTWAAYYGPSGRFSKGLPPNTFTASISSTGVVSNETGGDWINGNCTKPSGGNARCTFTSNFFSSAPHCFNNRFLPGQTTWTSAGGGSLMGAVTTSQMNLITPGVDSGIDYFVMCRKTGSDYIQDAITPDNTNYGPRAYTPTFTGFGTVSNVNCTEARDGVWNLIDCKFTSGTTTAVEARVSLPNSRTSPASLNSIRIAAESVLAYGAASTQVVIPLIEPSVSYITFGRQDLSGGLVKVLGTNIAGAGVTMAFKARVQINGWTETHNAPQLLGSVTSKKQSSINDIEGRIGGATDGTNCTGTCTVYDGPPGITATRNATGAYTINAVSGICQTALKCSFQGVSVGVTGVLCGKGGASSTTAYLLSCYQPGSSTPLDSLIDFRCTCGL